MRVPALLRQARAFLTGYFWLPCPLCGDYFAGYEWTESDQSIPTPDGGGEGVCRACISEARTMTALAEMTPTTKLCPCYVPREEEEEN